MRDKTKTDTHFLLIYKHLSLFSQRVRRARTVQVVTHVPRLPVFGLEVPQSRWLPEEVIRKHPQQREEHRRVEEPRSCLRFPKHLKN